jgi:hypothetical protein
MESLGPKLSSKIRPNREQLDEIQKLSMQLKTAVAGIESHVELLLRRAGPTDKERALANQIKAADEFDPAIFRKNLVLIFRGPDESALDPTKVQIRKAKSRTRCEKLRVESHHLILKWAMSFQPSAWIHPTVMADGTFDFLIQDLKDVTFDQIPPKIFESLLCLKDEEPLNTCEQFQSFVKNIERPTIVEEPEPVVQYKRKRTDQGSPPQRELRDPETNNDKQMIEQRSKGKLEATPFHA